MKRVRLFESFINEKGAVLGRGRKSVRVDFNDKRNMRWTVHGMQGDISKGIVILIATEYKQGQPSWWKLATVTGGEIKFQESELGEIPEWLKKKAIKDAGKYGFKNLEEVNESIEVVNEAEGKFDNTLHKKVLKAIASSKTYMQVEDDSDMREILIATRENGDVYDDTAGADDIKEAQRVQKILMKKFPGIKVQVETVDEWVHLSIKAPRVANFKYAIEMYDENEPNEYRRGMGGSEFATFKEMVQALEREYLRGAKVDFKSVEKELEAIDTYPRDRFTGWHQSKGIKIASGVKWGSTTVEIQVAKETDEIDYKTKKGI
jgi:hypothetical protein